MGLKNATDQKKFTFDANREFKKGEKQAAAYSFIKNAIITNVYKAQQPLNEKDLSIVLGGISRTPIHDALKRLVYEGLVENFPGKGMLVAQISIKDLLEIDEIRLPLECTSVRLFIERANDETFDELEEIVKTHEKLFLAGDYLNAVKSDNEFHFTICRGTMNNHLYNYIHQLIEEGSRGAFLTINDANHIKTSIHYHKLIYNAIKEKNVSLAEKYTREHIENWIVYIKDFNINKYFLFSKS